MISIEGKVRVVVPSQYEAAWTAFIQTFTYCVEEMHGITASLTKDFHNSSILSIGSSATSQYSVRIQSPHSVVVVASRVEDAVLRILETVLLSGLPENVATEIECSKITFSISTDKQLYAGSISSVKGSIVGQYYIGFADGFALTKDGIHRSSASRSITVLQEG